MTTTDQTKPAAAHTLEPWVHGDNGLIYGQCGEDDVEAPFVCDVIADSAMQALGMLSPVEEANARRIVAAVNACAGISTEALEQGVIRDLWETLQIALPILEEQATHIRLVSGGHLRCEAYDKALATIAEAAGHSSAAPRKPIVIEIRGGVLQDVSNVPPGYEYEVKDYDDQEDGAVSGETLA